MIDPKQTFDVQLQACILQVLRCAVEQPHWTTGAGLRPSQRVHLFDESLQTAARGVVIGDYHNYAQSKPCSKTVHERTIDAGAQATQDVASHLLVQATDDSNPKRTNARAPHCTLSLPPPATPSRVTNEAAALGPRLLRFPCRVCRASAPHGVVDTTASPKPP